MHEPTLAATIPTAAVPVRGVPDMAYIRKNVPIRAVARALDLREGSNKLIHCWHPERHEHGDRTASVAVHPRLNRVKCFGVACSGALMSPIDLVRDVLGLGSIRDAAQWITERFDVPAVPKGKRLTVPGRIIHTFGSESPIELLVRSGLYSRLSVAAQRISTALICMADPTVTKGIYSVRISYRGITRYTGLKSPNAIRQAVTELEWLGWLRPIRSRIGGSVIPGVNEYVLTPFADSVREAAQIVAGEFSADIRAEKEFRAVERRKRARILSERNRIPAHSLENSEQLPSIPGIA